MNNPVAHRAGNSSKFISLSFNISFFAVAKIAWNSASSLCSKTERAPEYWEYQTSSVKSKCCYKARPGQIMLITLIDYHAVGILHFFSTICLQKPRPYQCVWCFIFEIYHCRLVILGNAKDLSETGPFRTYDFLPRHQNYAVTLTTN